MRCKISTCFRPHSLSLPRPAYGPAMSVAGTNGICVSPDKIEARAASCAACPSWTAIAALSRINHSSQTRFSRQNVSAIVRNVNLRSLAGPNAPPTCAAVEIIQCDDKNPVSSSPHQITSSPKSYRSGNSISAAMVFALPAALPRLIPAGVRTSSSSP